MNRRHFQYCTSGRGIFSAAVALTGALALAAATATVPETPKANPHHADAWVLPVGEPALPEEIWLHRFAAIVPCAIPSTTLPPSPD